MAAPRKHERPGSAPLLTTGQVAAELGLARSTVLHLVHQGALPATRVADRWIVARADLEAFKARPRRRAAKLDAGQRAAIRDRLAAGETQRAVAAAFGVTHQAISMLARGCTWHGDGKRPEQQG